MVVPHGSPHNGGGTSQTLSERQGIMFSKRDLVVLAGAVALCGALAVWAPQPLEAAVVGHWTLDDPAGTSGTGAVVELQHARNGITVGAPTFGGAGANANTGTSASFPGTSYVDVPYSPDLNPSSFTLTAWAYADSAGSGYRSVATSRSAGGGSQGYIIYATPGNQWEFWTGNGPAAGNWDVLGGGGVALDTWTHLAISFDAGTNTKSFYINGAAPFTTTAQNYSPNALQDLHIGSGGDTGTQYYFTGSIDDMVLFNEVLDQPAIQDVMNNSIPDPQLLSSGKTYAYGQNLPGYDAGTYYFDDTHVQALGVFSTGEMTDGAYFPDGGTPTVPAVNPISGWGRPADTEADIIVDLEQNYLVTGVTLGTHVYTAFANGAPDDVTLTFSTDGVVFGSPVNGSFFTPSNGHSDFVVEVPGTLARYVKLEFDGGALPGGNKWMLDEVSVHGLPAAAAVIPEPSTLLIGSVLAGLAFGIGRRRRI